MMSLLSFSIALSSHWDSRGVWDLVYWLVYINTGRLSIGKKWFTLAGKNPGLTFQRGLQGTH